jgi:hypothetical protein
MNWAAALKVLSGGIDEVVALVISPPPPFNHHEFVVEAIRAQGAERRYRYPAELLQCAVKVVPARDHQQRI